MKILGISCYYHDSSAALIVDGKIVAAVANERFSRKKNDSDFPKLAIDFCLATAGITMKQIDKIVFYEKPFLKFERITLSALATAPHGRRNFVNAYKTWLKSKLWIKSHLMKELGVSSDKIFFSHHHTSHAAAAFYTSGFKSSALLTVDGVGEWTTTAWGSASTKNNEFKLTKEIRFPHSLGLLYSTFTQFLGFEVNSGEFKVMGLSPYGTPRFKKKIEKLIEQSEDGSFKLDMSYFNYQLRDDLSYSQKFVDLFGKPQDASKTDQVTQRYADIAASIQIVLEEKLLVIAKHIRKVTGETNLCYAGGVALNGVANWKLFKEAGFKNIWIHPAAGDDGAALGAALFMYHHVLDNPVSTPFTHSYFGSENSNSQIEEFIALHEISAQKYSDNALINELSTMIAKGKVIGMVRGRFEWGPRALGSRSILADPRSKAMKDIVNKKIKFREAFRPFAPVVTYEKAGTYFDLSAGRQGIPKVPPKILEYMLAVVDVRKPYRRSLRAVTHVNGSARPQLVKRKNNPFYYDLIKAFGKKTGIEVLLNTSFNLKGEPIVTTCEDAYKTFMESGIDVLVLGNYLIKKKQ